MFVGNNSYLIADSSFGDAGDQARFTLPVNMTSSQNLQFQFKNTGFENSSSNALKVKIIELFLVK